MKIINSLKSGLNRAFRVRTAVLLTWLSFFLLSILLIHPLRASLGSAFGSSMITERLADGLDIEVFSDLGKAGKMLVSSLANGVILTFLVAFILNAFLTGGLFGILGKARGKFSAREFFSSAAGNFLPFLGITFVLTVIAAFIFLILILVTMGISDMSDNPGGGPNPVIPVTFSALLFLVIPVLLLVADYARAWRASRDEGSCFAALGFGLRRTFRKFRRSYLLMVILILVQMLLLFVVFLMLPAWRPATGGGVFLMLIVSQLLLILRLFLKTWRYGSVTAMMESLEEVKHVEPQVIIQAEPAVEDNTL
jgi:magnesium-transporting ATPase (P-type)